MSRIKGLIWLVVTVAILFVTFLAFVAWQHSNQRCVLDVVARFKMALANERLSEAYALMSVAYTNQYNLNDFQTAVPKYKDYLERFSGNERVYLGRNKAKVRLLGASPNSNSGNVVGLVHTDEWRIESMDGFWFVE